MDELFGAYCNSVTDKNMKTDCSLEAKEGDLAISHQLKTPGCGT